MAKWNKGQPAHNRNNEMIGKRFGKLVVLAEHPEKDKDKRIQYVCQCDCGNTTITTGKRLRNGTAKSCGCLKSERLSKKNYRHGGAHRSGRERLYGIHRDMIRRCYDPRRNNYAKYGGRGIYVCDEWLKPDGDAVQGYINFRNWAYTNGYYDQPKDTPKSLMLSIDRIDNDGPYAPWNCRWTDMYGQSNNRGDFNQYIQVGDEVYTFGQFEKKFGLHKGRVLMMYKTGWTTSQIVMKALHPELKLHQSKKHHKDRIDHIYDDDGFIRLTKKTDQSKAKNKYKYKYM